VVGNLIAVDDTAYFFENDPVHGTALWRTDGTEAGTWVVKDGFSPDYDANGQIATSFSATSDGTFYFPAVDSHGSELWRSDGTTAGTYRVHDIRTGSAGSSPGNVTATPAGVFFFADDGVHGRELWVSDGTDAGTHIVVDLRTGTSGQTGRGPAYFHGAIYFGGTDGTAGGAGLWKTTGEAGNATVVTSSSSLSAPSAMAAFDGHLYVAAASGGLWRADDTSAEPVQIEAFGQWSFCDAGSALYCSGPSGIVRIDRGSTDVTTVGPGTLSNLAVVGSDAYFFITSSLWRVAADSTTPTLVATFDSASAGPQLLTAVGSDLYFQFGSTLNFNGLWVFPGDGGGPHKVMTFNTGQPDVYRPRSLTAVGGRLVLVNDLLANGDELWTTDGAPEHTRIIRAAYANTDGSAPVFYGRVGGRVIFRADDRLRGPSLWSAGPDGELSYISAGMADPGAATFLVAADGAHAYFSAGNQVWMTDGTAAGTRPLKDTVKTTSASGYTEYNGRVYFAAGDAASGVELWSSDGTTAGTSVFFDVYTGTSSSNPGNFVVANGLLYFTATDQAHGSELWVTDGTAAGTHVVADIKPGTAGSGPTNLTAFAGGVYFTADDGTTGSELWKSDGSASGTVRVKDVRPGASGSASSSFWVVGGSLYFTADDGVHGHELWRSDGTPAGTSLYFEGIPGDGSSVSASQVTRVNDRLFWFASNSAGALELWRVGGAGGDVRPTLVTTVGDGKTQPANLASAGGRLYFSIGGILWSSDGTAAGSGIVPGVSGNVYTQSPLLGTADGSLYFGASTPSLGTEPYVLRDTFAPIIEDAWFDATTGRTARVEFNESVDPGRAMVRLTHRTTGQELSPDAFVVTYESNTRILSITLRSPADGDYRVSVLSDGLTDLSGNAMAVGTSLDFFVLGGDANHDRVVDFNDLVKLAQNYNTVGGKTFAEGDFNFDGNVDFNDLVILAQRYNTGLGAGVASAASVLADLEKTKKGPVARVVTTAPVAAPKKPAPVVKKVVRSPFATGRVGR